MEEESHPSIRELLQLGQRELSAPHESSDSSVHQPQQETSFSVRIFPQLGFFPADLFEEVCLPGIIHILGSSEDGAGYTWPQRGWQNRQELEGEVQAALALADVGTVGIVIARVQSRQQADGLVQRMAELQINAAAENVANPPLSASWIAPAAAPSSHRSRAPASQSRRPQRQNSAETERAVQELMRTTLYEGNKAPVAKAAVRSSLPTFVVGTQRSDDPPVLPDWWPKSEVKLNLHDKDDCLFCMEAFQTGETVSFLPCGHCYHLGAEGAGAGRDDDAGCCKGIRHWLESSNVCPICRFPVPVDETSATPPDAGDWVCPLCSVSNSIGADCPCGCLYTSQLLAAEGNMSSYFRGVEGLFASMLGAPRPLSEQQREIFSAQVQAMTDHPVVQSAEEGGWEIRVAITNLLTDVLEGANGGEIVVKSGGADRNSLGVIGVLVRRLSAIQTSAAAPPVPPPSPETLVATAQPTAPPVPPAAPRISFSSDEYSFDPENFQSAYFPRISDNVRGFLRQNNRVFSRTARLIVKGGSGVEWEALTTNIFPQMERSNWNVSVAVGMMRGGVRDYGVLTSGLVNGDVGSRVCIEALLEMIRGYERSGDARSHAGPASASPDFKRQPSIGTLARQHLDSLRSRLSPELFLRVLGTLTTIVKNVRQDPSSEKFRKLKKSNRTLSECILAHPECGLILEGIGFVDVGGAEGHLHLVYIKELDLIIRTLGVLRDYRDTV